MRVGHGAGFAEVVVTRDALQGDTGGVGLFSVLQLAELEAMSGRFEVAAGTITLHRGQVVAAEAGSLTGIDAVYELLLAPPSRFVLRKEEVAGGEPLAPTAILMLEGCRLLDEWQRLAPMVLAPAGGAVVEGLPSSLLSRLDGRRPLESAVSRAGLARARLVDPILAALEARSLEEKAVAEPWDDEDDRPTPGPVLLGKGPVAETSAGGSRHAADAVPDTADTEADRGVSESRAGAGEGDAGPSPSAASIETSSPAIAPAPSAKTADESGPRASEAGPAASKAAPALPKAPPPPAAKPAPPTASTVPAPEWAPEPPPRSRAWMLAIPVFLLLVLGGWWGTREPEPEPVVPASVPEAPVEAPPVEAAPVEPAAPEVPATPTTPTKPAVKASSKPPARPAPRPAARPESRPAAPPPAPTPPPATPPEPAPKSTPASTPKSDLKDPFAR